MKAVVTARFPAAFKKAAAKATVVTLTDKALAAKLSNPKGWSRWWNSISGDATFMHDLLPPGDQAKVFVDDRCGRFLVAYASEDRRSFSWTKRGMKDAQLLALQHLWESHRLHTGQVCPFSLSAV